MNAAGNAGTANLIDCVHTKRRWVGKLVESHHKNGNCSKKNTPDDARLLV